MVKISAWKWLTFRKIEPGLIVAYEQNTKTNEEVYRAYRVAEEGETPVIWVDDRPYVRIKKHDRAQNVILSARPFLSKTGSWRGSEFVSVAKEG